MRSVTKLAVWCVAQGAAVLAQVERVEVVAARHPVVGGRGLEEVVGEAVHVQHRPAARTPRRPVHQRGDDLALVVVAGSMVSAR